MEYTYDADGNLTDRHIVVGNENILKALGVTNGSFSSFTSKTGINDIFKVFKFASDNTDVEWALHRGRGNEYTIGTSHKEDGVAAYYVLSGRDEIPIASIHSHPNEVPSYINETETMGYGAGWVQVGNDLQKVMWGQSPVYNYVYFPVSGHIYNVQKPSAVYIKSLGINYRGLYWGTLNHR